MCTKPLTLGTGGPMLEGRRLLAHGSSAHIRSHRDGHRDPLPLLRLPVRNQAQCGDDGARGGGEPGVSRQQGGALHQGLHLERDARASGPPANPARAHHDGKAGPASWDEALDRIASSVRATQESYGPRRGRRLRRRVADEREGLPARQVRTRRLGTREHRLQRPLLHVARRRAAIKAFGVDRGLPFPVEDIARGGRDPARRRATRRKRCRRSCSTSGAAAAAAR